MSEDSWLVAHAKRELTLLGYPEGPTPAEDNVENINYWMRDSVLALVQLFASQGHSGASAAECINLTTRLLNGENLTPLTNDPDEWEDRTALAVEAGPLYQNKRNGTAFSKDGGKTYTLLNEQGILHHSREYTK